MAEELIKYLEEKCNIYFIEDSPSTTEPVYTKEDVQEVIREFFLMKGF